MKTNFFGHPIEWVWTMKKINTPLSVSSYAPGAKMGKQSFGYPLILSATWYDHGDIYFDKEEVDTIRRFISYTVQHDVNYPDIIAQKIKKIHHSVLKQSIQKDQLSKYSLRDLVKFWQSKNKLFLQMIGFMSYRGSIQMSEVLQQQFEDTLMFRLARKNRLSEIVEYRESLSVPLGESDIVAEERSLLSLAHKFPKLSEKQKIMSIQKHCQTFEWLRYHWFVGTPCNEEEIRQNIEMLVPQADTILKNLDKERKLQETKINRIIHSLKFTKADSLMYRQYREWLFFRTYVKDTISLAGYKLLPILYAMADKLQVSQEHISLFTFDEINRIHSLTKADIHKIIAERKDGFSAGIIENKFSFGVFSKPTSTIESHNESEIKGMVAFRGICHGVARVIASPKEQDRVRDGEILVISMTTPDYLPAMKRAAAFVTDEGGITCHAAIVAREMKKPCIIGTKNATKLLNDGDEVDVDAEKGIVRKIEK